MKKKVVLTVFAVWATACCMLFGFTACGDNQSKPEHTHAYGEWQVVTQATCTKDGEKKRECSCGDMQTEKIPASPHRYSEEWTAGETRHWHACTVCGDKKDSQDHTMSNKKCTVCGKLQSTQGLEFHLNHEKNVYSVTGIGTATDTDIVIPTEYNGIPVTVIDNFAFEDRSKLTSITIPDNVTTIGDNAFYGCKGLTNITIPDSVTNIGELAFLGCWRLIEVYNKSSLHITTGSKDNGYVGYYAKNVYTAEGGSKLTTDENGFIFYEENTLVNYIGTANQLTIPSTVTTVNQYAFDGCSGLTSVTIPDSVSNIGTSAFASCYRLIEIYNKSSLNITASSGDNGYVGYHAKNVYTNENGSKLATDKNGFIIYNGKSLVNYIGTSTEISIPSTITTINQYAFYDLNKLTNITIPDNVTYIGESTFKGCSGLTSITVPDNVTYIGASAFENCSGLTSINIPDNVTSIGYCAFSGCNRLTSFTIPDTVTSIGFRAFSGCSRLTNITIPDSVTYISDYAFYDCSGLTNIEIPNNVARILDYTFYGCSGLTSITIPKSITNIGDRAFYGCSELKNIYYYGTAEDWAKITIAGGNSELQNAALYYYSETEPTEAGNYWHYDTDGVTPVVWKKN